MSEHDHHDHDHAAEPRQPVPLTPDDAGSRALSEALQSSFWIVKGLMLVMVGGFFISGCFSVEPQQRALLLRFGKPVGVGEQALFGPGLHWAFPPPIDEVRKIPFSQVQEATSSAGWYFTTPEAEAARQEPPPPPSLNPARDSYLITADANIIHARATLRYRITDPVQFTFGFSNAYVFVTNALNNALYYAAAQMTVDDALTRNVSGFREKIANRVSQLVDQQKLGIAIEQVNFDRVIPPRQLRTQFNAVLDASLKRDRALNGAREYETEALNRATGEASSRTNIAASDSARLVATVAADAEKFSNLLPKYRENPALFMELRRAETLARMMTNAQEKIFLSAEPGGKAPTLRLLLGREPLKPKPPPEPPKEDH